MKQDTLTEVAGFKPPSKVPLIAAAIAGLAVGAVVSGLLTAAAVGDGKSKKRGSKPAAAASASASASASVAAVGSATPKPAAKGTLAERATKGDAEAVKQIEAKPQAERTAEETLALVDAAAIARRKEIAELTRKIGLVPNLLKEDKDVKKRIGEFLDDREVANDLLRAYANLPGETGPNLLWSIATGPKKKTTSEIAENLLYSKDVRAKASKALSVALDLKQAEKCEDALALLARAKDDGDRRSLGTLMRYHQKRGCGEKKRDDCWPCLRDGDALKDATIAVQRRAPP